MVNAKLKNMFKGWFIGNFTPTVYKTNACEVAIKSYKSGESEAKHFHKVATEITIVLSGRIKMAGKLWKKGDIILIEPGEATDFEASTNAVTVVIKLPGELNDKYASE